MNLGFIVVLASLHVKTMRHRGLLSAGDAEGRKSLAGYMLRAPFSLGFGTR
jgi:hypothetical protein